MDDPLSHEHLQFGEADFPEGELFDLGNGEIEDDGFHQFVNDLNLDYLSEDDLQEIYAMYIDHLKLVDQPMDTGDYSLRQLTDHCVRPMLQPDSETATFLFTYCALCLLQRVILNLPHVGPGTRAFSIGVLGLYLAVIRIHIQFVVSLLAIGLVVYIVSKTVSKVHIGHVCAALCVVYMLVCEYTMGSVAFTKARGPIMIAIMKIVSVGFDLQNENTEEKDASSFALVKLFGYVFDVSSIMFGPWTTYDHWTRCMLSRDSFRTQLLAVMAGLTKLVMAVVCLVFSSCFADWLFYAHMPGGTLANPLVYIWLKLYTDALSFRSSHYFVSFLAETSTLLAGSSLANQIVVTRILPVEMPRSLVQISINWNLPQHKFLKLYVFRQSRQMGNFMAILMTYAVSSLLHGLNAQMSLVLLSLGLYTYPEHVLRHRLSTIFDACICARQCPASCQHKHTSMSGWVTIVNLVLGALALWHLTYLAGCFNQSDEADQGYSLRHALDVWGSVSYGSHIVGFITLALSLCI